MSARETRQESREHFNLKAHVFLKGSSAKNSNVTGSQGSLRMTSLTPVGCQRLNEQQSRSVHENNNTLVWFILYWDIINGLILKYKDLSP